MKRPANASRYVGAQVGVQSRQQPIGGLRLGRIQLIYADSGEPTSGLEPLTCSLRVIHQALLGVARGCKSPISNGFSFPWLALCCTVLRSRWCQEYLDHASPLPSQTGSATELISAPSRLE